MTEGLDRTDPSHDGDGMSAAPASGATASVPLCFIVDGAPSIRHFLSLVLHGVGLETEEFADDASFRQALHRSAPDLVFFDVGLESAAAIEAMLDLGKRGYPGFVQLVSDRGAAVLEHVKSIGEQRGLR